MENKKIIIATGIFPPEIGGPATYTEKLAQELKNRGFETGVITYFNPVNYEIDNQEVNMSFSRCGLAAASAKKTCSPPLKLSFCNSKFNLGSESKKYDFPLIKISRRFPLGIRHFLYFWRLLKIAKDFDVIYAQCPVSSGLPACCAAKILDKKFALKIVGDYAWEQAKVNYNIRESIETFQNRKDYPFKIKILKFLEKWVAKNAKQIIIPSNYLKNIIVQWGVRQDRIKVVYNSIENAVIFSDLNKEEAQNKIKIKGNIFLSAGRLVPWKGFDVLIKIMPELLTKNIRFKLVIAGSGPEEDNLKNLIKDLHLENYVFLIGQINHSEMAYYFKAADLFVLNTGYEGLSHIILEAMRYELPVVTTQIGGNPEIIEHNYNGLLAEYNNKKELIKAIWNLWQDKESQNRFTENSKKVLEKFTFERMFKETLEVLNK